jgi:hypothetical protein
MSQVLSQEHPDHLIPPERPPARRAVYHPTRTLDSGDHCLVDTPPAGGVPTKKHCIHIVAHADGAPDLILERLDLVLVLHSVAQCVRQLPTWV